jgi:Rrf2 family iron-sulfur cluster assembly transcriptional regulator
MKLSTKARYAVRMLSELGSSEGPVPIAVLSEKTGISSRALEKVHGVLKRHRATGAFVGAGGGIILRKSLSEISLGQVIDWFDNGVELTVCCGRDACPRQKECATRTSCQFAARRLTKALHAVPLADMLCGA